MKKYVTLSVLFILLMSIIPIFRTSATSTTITVNPANLYVAVNEDTTATVSVNNVANLTSWQFTMYFLNSILNCTDAAEGPFLQSGGGTYFGYTINNNYNATDGSVTVYDTLLGNTTVAGSGTIASITFNALTVGQTTLQLSETELGDQNIPPQDIPHTTVDGTVYVQNFTLTLTVVGGGTVTLNDTGPYYANGETVQLTANPSVGWSFQGWTGDLTGSTNPADLVMTGNMAVTVTFTQNQYTLTVNIAGSGSVTENPSQATYTWGTNVTLTATATLGWSFLGWTGDVASTANPVIINMTSSMSVTATFTQNTYTLNVSVSPVSSGVVDLNKSGPYNYGDVVQLTAVPAAGWSFAQWSGNLVGSGNPATLTMTNNMTVTATFIQNVYTLTLNVVGTGSLGLNSTGPYHYGDTVQLTASAPAGWIFYYWSGALTGSANPAMIVMTGNFTVFAYFTQQPTLQFSPASRTCRMYSENFTVAISISNAVNVGDFKFEIHYNATLLNCTGIIWNAWGSGTYTLNAATGNITGSTGGTLISGTLTIVTIEFEASFYHIWMSAAGWTNDLTDTIYFQWANVSYSDGPDLTYQRGGSSNQFSVGSDFGYTFSPIQGDVNNDGTVDIFDLRTVAAYFGVEQGDSAWANASKYDLNGDQMIDVFDLRIIAANFGYTYKPS